MLIYYTQESDNIFISQLGRPDVDYWSFDSETLCTMI